MSENEIRENLGRLLDEELKTKDFSFLNHYPEKSAPGKIDGILSKLQDYFSDIVYTPGETDFVEVVRSNAEAERKIFEFYNPISALEYAIDTARREQGKNSERKFVQNLLYILKYELRRREVTDYKDSFWYGENRSFWNLANVSWWFAEKKFSEQIHDLMDGYGYSHFFRELGRKKSEILLTFLTPLLDDEAFDEYIGRFARYSVESRIENFAREYCKSDNPEAAATAALLFYETAHGEWFSSCGPSARKARMLYDLAGSLRSRIKYGFYGTGDFPDEILKNINKKAGKTVFGEYWYSVKDYKADFRGIVKKMPKDVQKAFSELEREVASLYNSLPLKRETFLLHTIKDLNIIPSHIRKAYDKAKRDRERDRENVEPRGRNIRLIDAGNQPGSFPNIRPRHPLPPVAPVQVNRANTADNVNATANQETNIRPAADTEKTANRTKTQGNVKTQENTKTERNTKVRKKTENAKTDSILKKAAELQAAVEEVMPNMLNNIPRCVEVCG